MPAICLVEDDQFLSQLYARKFEQEGFSVVCAKTAHEAEEYLFSHEPDCVVLDIGLPDKSGLDVLESLRLKGGCQNVRFVILTNNDALRDMKRARRLGGVLYLLKSNYTPTEVVEEVKKTLR